MGILFSLLTREEKKEIKKIISKTENIELDISDINFNQLTEAFISSQLPRLAYGGEEKVKVEEKNGAYYQLAGNGNISEKVDEKYYEIIETYKTITPNAEIDLNFIKKIYLVFDNIMNKVKKIGQKTNNLGKEIVKLAKSIDKYYAEMRQEIISLENKYDDSIINLLLLLPDMLVFFLRYMSSKNISLINKTKIILALTYVVSTLDIIPEGIVGYIGFIDDLYIVLEVLQSILSDENVEKEEIYRLWPGKRATLDNLDEYIEKIKGLLGEKLIKIINVLYNSIRTA